LKSFAEDQGKNTKIRKINHIAYCYLQNFFVFGIGLYGWAESIFLRKYLSEKPLGFQSFS